jgi:hypothetical protein
MRRISLAAIIMLAASGVAHAQAQPRASGPGFCARRSADLATCLDPPHAASRPPAVAHAQSPTAACPMPDSPVIQRIADQVAAGDPSRFSFWSLVSPTQKASITPDDAMFVEFLYVAHSQTSASPVRTPSGVMIRRPFEVRERLESLLMEFINNQDRRKVIRDQALACFPAAAQTLQKAGEAETKKAEAERARQQQQSLEIRRQQEEARRRDVEQMKIQKAEAEKPLAGRGNEPAPPLPESKQIYSEGREQQKLTPPQSTTQPAQSQRQPQQPASAQTREEQQQKLHEEMQSPSTREQVASYAEQMASAMRMIVEGNSGLSCYDLAACGRWSDRLIYKVEDARQIIAAARANEPTCIAEAGAATSAFIDRYYDSLLNVRTSIRAGDFAGTIASAQKATANVSDTTAVTGALERARVACQGVTSPTTPPRSLSPTTVQCLKPDGTPEPCESRRSPVTPKAFGQDNEPAPPRDTRSKDVKPEPRKPTYEEYEAEVVKWCRTHAYDTPTATVICKGLTR